MMNENINSIWEKLDSAESIYAKEYKALKTGVKSEIGEELLIAMDSENQFRHLFIPIPKGRFIDDVSSRGVNILYQKFNTPLGKTYIIDLVCTLPHLNELFSIIVSEIIEEIKTNKNEPYKTCKRILERWRELIGKKYTHNMSEEKIQGVFGELWYLRELTDIDLNAINYWQGPALRPHDFSNGLMALEIKTTSKKGRIISINGIQQLTPPEKGILYLCAIKLEKVKRGGKTIPDLIKSLKELGLDYTKLLSQLADIGYSVQDTNYYKNFRYQIKENRVYLVDEDFPKIVENSFKNDKLPNNVIDISYIIDITSEPPFPLPEREVELLLEDFCYTGKDFYEE